MREQIPKARSARVRERLARPAPEWETERWKHLVEAEARSRFKKRILGVGRIHSRGRH
jgi:hypothetical protein